MLRTALALLSSLQIGLRFKGAIERSLRQALGIAVAAVVLIAGASFGLLAAYDALISLFGFTPLQASGIVAAVLTVLGLLILATLPLFYAEAEVAGAERDGLGQRRHGRRRSRRRQGDAAGRFRDAAGHRFRRRSLGKPPLSRRLVGDGGNKMRQWERYARARIGNWELAYNWQPNPS